MVELSSRVPQDPLHIVEHAHADVSVFPLHERLALYAIGAGRSLNSCVQEALERYVATVVEA